MCGRIERRSPREAIADQFGVSRFVNVDLRPRYNVAPSQFLESIIRVGDEKRFGPMRRGFLSADLRNPKLAPINLRAEARKLSKRRYEITVGLCGSIAGRVVNCPLVSPDPHRERQDGRIPLVRRLRVPRSLPTRRGRWSHSSHGGPPCPSCIADPERFAMASVRGVLSINAISPTIAPAEAVSKVRPPR
jgi:hypothetical protein